MLRALLVACVLVVGCTPAAVLPSPTTSTTASPTISATPSPVARTATPLVPDSPSVGVAARGSIDMPSDARLLAISDAFGERTRVWLIDLSGRTAPVSVASWRGPRPGFVSATLSASADSRSAVVGAWGPNGHAALYGWDVPTGRVTFLYEDPTTDVPSYLFPAITPDGTRVAFETADDVRMMGTTGGPAQRLVAHPERTSVYGRWHPVAWSVGGALLALERSSEGQSELAIVPAAGGPARVLGTGTSAAWRAGEPQLVVTGGVGAFGGQNLMYTYDVSAGVRRDLDISSLPLSSWIGTPQWDPGSDRLTFTVSQRLARPREVWARSPTGPATKQPFPDRYVRDFWWSRAGSTLYALVPRADAMVDSDTANLEVIDVASGRRIALFCRGDDRAGPCP